MEYKVRVQIDCEDGFNALIVDAEGYEVATFYNKAALEHYQRLTAEIAALREAAYFELMSNHCWNDDPKCNCSWHQLKATLAGKPDKTGP